MVLRIGGEHSLSRTRISKELCPNGEVAEDAMMSRVCTYSCVLGDHRRLFAWSGSSMKFPFFVRTNGFSYFVLMASL